jgi:hydrogenase expression/formation protein HypC
MCLGIPGRIQQLLPGAELRMAKVEFGGVLKQVCLEYVPEAEPGDYVLVHVGFALCRIDEQEALRVFELLREMEGPPQLEPGESE